MRNLLMEHKFHLWDKLSTPPMNNLMVMCTKLDHCSSQIDLFVDNVIHVCNTCVNTKGKVGANFAKWWTRLKCLLPKMKDNVANPSNFVFVTIKKKIFTFIKLQHCKWPKHLAKKKIEIILYVNHLHLVHQTWLSYFLFILASNQNGLLGSQLDEVKNRHHHWIWLEQMEPFESTIVI